jgi:hypothetical protein
MKKIACDIGVTLVKYGIKNSKVSFSMKARIIFSKTVSINIFVVLENNQMLAEE